MGKWKVVPGCMAVMAACVLVPASAQTASLPAVTNVEGAVRAAVTQHPSVKSRQSEIAAARFDVDAAKAGRYPTVSVSRQSSARSGSSSAGGVVAVQQPIWAGGRIDSAIDLANRRQTSSETSLREVRRQLIEDTLVAYLNLQAARVRLQVAEQNIEEHQRLRDMISRRMSGGVASNADVNLAASRIGVAITLRDQIRGEIAKAQSDLQALTLARVDDALPIPDLMLDIPGEAQLIGMIEDASPAIQRRKDEVEVVRAQGDIARAQLMPTVSVRLERDLAPAVPENANYSYSRGMVVFQASVEGSGFAGIGRVQAEAQRLNGAMEDVESARNDVLRRARGFLVDRATYVQVFRNQDEVVRISEDTMASFLRQFDAGRKSWVDVLNTQRELADARQSRERTRAAMQEMSLRLGTLAGIYDNLAGIQ